MLRSYPSLERKSRFTDPAIILISIGLWLSVVNCSSPSLPGFPQDSPFDKASPSLTGAVSHGVATGDVTSDTALVWLRTDGPTQVEFRFDTVNNWERFELGGAQRQPSVKTEQFTTKKEQDFTLKVPLEGLIPATRYRYDVRTIQPAQLSVSTTGIAQGEFMTAPSSDESVPATFLWSADLGDKIVVGMNRPDIRFSI